MRFNVLYTAIKIEDRTFVNDYICVEAEDFDDAEIVAKENISDAFDNIEILAVMGM